MEFTRVEVRIDCSDPNAVQGQIQDFSAALAAAGQAVELDLLIVPSAEDPAGFSVTRTDEAGDSELLAMDSFGRLEGHSFSIAFDSYYHLILEILHGSPTEAPFSTVAWLHRSEDPARCAFSVRGCYASSIVPIPTAYDVQLRPLTPRI